MTEKTPEGEEIFPAAEQGMPVEEEKDIYTQEGKEKLVEDGEISPAEEGFMQGASGHGQLGHCASCDKPLSDDASKVVERVINGEKFQYCSDECSQKP